MHTTKKTIEEFGYLNNYKGIKGGYFHKAQDLWVEICYNFYTLDIINKDHANTGDDVCNVVFFEYVRKLLESGNLK